MALFWMLLAIAVASTTAIELTGEQYYLMPRLFQLDDIEECLANRRGTFCLGSFHLLGDTNTQLLEVIKQFSADKYHFNHTHIHRGYCLTKRCAHIEGATPERRFERCVDNNIRAHYGLETNLTRLEYCRTGDAAPRPVDGLDLAFAGVVGLIILMNAVGTAYHVARSRESKPNRYLMCWSLISSWNRLTADYSHGEPRLSALKPIQGMKALTLILVMLAHSVLAHHTTYIYNPQFLERSSHHLLSVYFQNGTSIVQTFVMVSSFLLAYNLLLHSDRSQPRLTLTLKMLPQTLMHRLVRITPLYMFVVGTAMTWWPHSSSGPLWKPLIEDETARCRDKWWAQLLYVNNLVKPEEKCLIHTWFLAVDMQLYVLSAMLTLSLGRWPRVALRVLAGLFIGSIIINFSIAYHWNLKPMVVLMFPEYMRTQFDNEPSFSWLYTAPWDSLPAALVGLLLAFLHHTLQHQGFKAEQSSMVRIMYRASVPAMFLWVLGGYWMKGVTDRLWVATYATLDRPVFITLTAAAMYGFFNKIDSLWWRFLSWRGWEVLGRMSLSVYLVHWLHALTQLAVRTNAARVSVYEIGTHWLGTITLSYVTALPLHLFIEVPMQRFLQSLF